PAYYAETILFTDEERAALRRLLDLGLVDLFRRFHDEPKLYSWWDYRMNAFRRNLGARIDLLLATPSLAERALSCDVDRAPRALEKPSDHAPVVARFRLA
ncbi:MAG TPA: exodeoxyribonuclease III, partial [Acidobacteriota bacterium]|nr:exodeoxyribonuclease III [Acidobacteriota bacterium]